MYRYINELNGELYYSKWTVEGGLNGETCSDSETREGGVLWCDNVIIPDCEDRTINCTDPPMPKQCSQVCLLRLVQLIEINFIWQLHKIT